MPPFSGHGPQGRCLELGAVFLAASHFRIHAISTSVRGLSDCMPQGFRILVGGMPPEREAAADPSTPNDLSFRPRLPALSSPWVVDSARAREHTAPTIARLNAHRTKRPKFRVAKAPPMQHRSSHKPSKLSNLLCALPGEARNKARRPGANPSAHHGGSATAPPRPNPCKGLWLGTGLALGLVCGFAEGTRACRCSWRSRKDTRHARLL